MSDINNTGSEAYEQAMARDSQQRKVYGIDRIHMEKAPKKKEVEDGERNNEQPNRPARP